MDNGCTTCAGTPPPPSALATHTGHAMPSLSTSTRPSPSSLVRLDAAAAADVTPTAVLWRLLREWCSGVAELLLGEVAAADVMGYSAIAFSPTLWTQQEGFDGAERPASPHTAASDAEVLLDSLHDHSATDRVVAKLSVLLPSLCADATADLPSLGVSRRVSLSHGALLPSLAMPFFRSADEAPSSSLEPPSPLRSMPTAAPHASPALPPSHSSSSWGAAFVDSVNAALDAFDRVVDVVFAPCLSTAPSSAASSSSTLALPIASHLSLNSRSEGAEESCIVAGLLLSRHVRVRSGPAYATVTAPLLVVLDLDLTVLRQPLSSITYKATQSMSLAARQALFVDPVFLCAFCAAVSRSGHELAICSLTEGTADQHSCGLSVAEVVVWLLSAVLPPARHYLTSRDDVVCLPKSVAGPGKLFHLQLLQHRRNARDTTPLAPERTDGGATLPHPRDIHKGSVNHVPPESGDALCGLLVPPLPRWLSTDVVLIDDDKENCRLAVAQGYHAAHCARTGMTARWFAARPHLQMLLGVSAEELV